MLIAVTGAGGFLGRALVARAAARGMEVRAIARTPAAGMLAAGDLTAMTDPEPLFAGCDAVIHLAARVHVTRETAADPLAEYLRVNRDLTLRLADAAARAGARRFVHAGSVAAIRSVAPDDRVADDATPPDPDTPYGASKLAADRALEDVAVSAVSLRLPTLYGPGVGAFFARLARVARLGLPLPIGAFDNRRSFLYVENAADALLVAAEGQARGSFIVTDSPPLSTADLYRAMLAAAGRRAPVPRLPRAPVALLARAILGDRVTSLLGSAAFDGSRFAATFGWSPPVDFGTAIARTMAAR